MTKKGGLVTRAIMALGLIIPASLTGPLVSAQSAATTGGFSVQVTPSPFVETVKPGIATTSDITLQNTGTADENLKVEIRHFTYDSDTGNVNIDDTAATDLGNWVTFSNPKFTIKSGQAFTQHVKLNFPSNSGFSYSFVVLFSRQSVPQATGQGRILQGSLADFALVNIDRPGATKELDINSIKTSAGIYEYAPAEISVKLNNKGNTIVQPAGSIFIGRGSADKPISTLKFNETQSYVLPGTTRTIKASWTDAFPRTVTDVKSDGTSSTHTVWNWGDLSKFRIGPYTAKVVAIYNNGSYDVPLNADVSFWILPWKIILIALGIFLIFAFGIFMIIRGAVKGAGSRRGGGFRL